MISNNKAWALLEILVVTALLSLSLPLMLGFFHTSINTPNIDEREILGRQLASNMAERYRHLSRENLEALINENESAEYNVSRDGLLNGPAALSSQKLANMGYRRRVIYLPEAGLRPARLLSLVELPSQPPILLKLNTFLPARSQRNGGVTPLFSLVRTVDMMDGEADYHWPSNLVVKREALVQLLAKTPISDGIFSYEGHQVVGDETCTIYRLSQPDKSDLLMMREDLAGMSFINGMAMRGPFVRRLVYVPTMDVEERKVLNERVWALVFVTQANLFLIYPQLDHSGEPLYSGQKLIHSSLPQTWQEGKDQEWQQGLEQVLQRLGCSEEMAGASVDVSALRHRLRW